MGILESHMDSAAHWVASYSSSRACPGKAGQDGSRALVVVLVRMVGHLHQKLFLRRVHHGSHGSAGQMSLVQFHPEVHSAVWKPCLSGSFLYHVLRLESGPPWDIARPSSRSVLYLSRGSPSRWQLVEVVSLA